MAIQVRNPYIGAVSVSLNTSRTSPSKLFVVGVGYASTSSVPFSGKTSGYGTERTVFSGKTTFNIVEYCDNSSYLDQNNIILFRRGMPSYSIGVTATVVIPRLRLVMSGQRANITFWDEVKPITVERLAGRDTLGSESWADNPCSGSQARYQAGEALSLIGAPRTSNHLVSYEGQYRSVLSSIYNDSGYTYFWNFTTAGITAINSNASFGTINLPDSCSVISVSSGRTTEGARSHSSFTYQNGRAEQIRSASFSRRFFSSFTVSPKKSSLWPPYDEIINQLCGIWYLYRALQQGGGNLNYWGLTSLGGVRLPSLPAGTAATREWKKAVGWDEDIDEDDNWDRILNIPKFRVNSRSKDTEESGDTWRNGRFHFAIPRKPTAQRVYNFELFYPYEKISMQKTTQSYLGGKDPLAPGMSVTKYSSSWTPHSSGRGFSPCENSTERALGQRRKGYWRQPNIYSPDELGEGFNSDLIFQFNLACTEAVSDCFIQVNLDAWLLWEQISTKNFDTANPPRRSLHAWARSGGTIVWVRRPRGSLSVGSSSSINCSDISEVAGYKDPNDLTLDPEPGQDPLKFKTICRSPIEDIQEEDNETLKDPLRFAKNVEPGLLNARGESIRISCGGLTRTWVLPSLSPYQVTNETVIDFDIRGKLYYRQTGAGNAWLSSGSKSGGIGGASQHTVSVTDVTPPGDGSPTNVPAKTNATMRAWTKIVATDFIAPITAALESLSANLSSDGFSITYNYKDPAQITPTTQIFSNPKAGEGGTWGGSVSV